MNNDKIYSVANLANETRRLMSQVKDLSTETAALNLQMQHIVMLMEARQDVLILKDEEGNHVVGLFDLNEPIEIPEEIDPESDSEDAWISDIELVPVDVIDTWSKFERFYGGSLASRAKIVANELSELIEKVGENVGILARICENMELMAEAMRDDLNVPAENLAPTLRTVDHMAETKEATEELCRDLISARTILPIHEFLTPQQLNNLVTSPAFEAEKGPEVSVFEESRPFPNAWS